MIKDEFSKRLGFDVDSNIEPIVYYLNKNNAKTRMSCGHDERNRIILKSKKSLENARKALGRLDIPKAADVKIFQQKVRIDKKQVRNTIEFKRGYAHVIVKKIKTKYPSFKETK